MDLSDFTTSISDLTVYWELPLEKGEEFTDNDIDTLIGNDSWYVEIFEHRKLRLWFVKPEDMAIVKMALSHLETRGVRTLEDELNNVRSRTAKYKW